MDLLIRLVELKLCFVFFWRTLSFVVLGCLPSLSCRLLPGRTGAHRLDSYCQHSSALLLMGLFLGIWNCHSSKGSCLTFYTQSFLKFASTSGSISVSVLALLLTKPKPVGSRCKPQWSALQCECTCRSRMHLTACQMPDAGYKMVWELTTSVFVMEHFGGTMWILPHCLEKKEETCCCWCFVYQGLASCRFGCSGDHWLLFSSSRRPFPCLILFVFFWSNGKWIMPNIRTMTKLIG